MRAATRNERPLHFLRLPEIKMIQTLSIVKKMIDYPGAGVRERSLCKHRVLRHG